MEVGGSAFRDFADLIEMEVVELYEEPSDRMMQQLQEKPGRWASTVAWCGRVARHRV